MTLSFKVGAAVAGFVSALLSAAAIAPRPSTPSSDGGDLLGTQQCNTECQERFTDCIDRCDGVLRCQKECNRVVDECVKACVTAPPEPSAKPAPSGKPRPAPSAAPAPSGGAPRSGSGSSRS